MRKEARDGILELQVEVEQAGFLLRQSGPDFVFVPRNISEKVWVKDKSICVTFLDQKAAVDSVPRCSILIDFTRKISFWDLRAEAYF